MAIGKSRAALQLAARRPWLPRHWQGGLGAVHGESLISEIIEATEAFDPPPRRSVATPTEAAVEQLVAEAEAEAEGEPGAADALTTLMPPGQAVQQLQEAPAGVSPVTESSSSFPW